MPIKKKKDELMPGTTIECESGKCLAYYEHRTDIIANGENEKDAIENLRSLYRSVVAYEKKEGVEHEDDDKPLAIPPHFIVKSFKDKLVHH